ncbi:glycosyl hydrolases family 18-domain-containing protein [Multifurca ochricompacta]|uniref:Glycosyl hydrolases family 18-domain-containing protein n=1 Tax=Multifurca ochricompacta TaxID=376703 RepID=A0AAD4QN59_9AGAM|nr:glycosyl hydrolases family 18-domain-containing protein [Multifurca ochricompacta]
MATHSFPMKLPEGYRRPSVPPDPPVSSLGELHMGRTNTRQGADPLDLVVNKFCGGGPVLLATNSLLIRAVVFVSVLLTVGILANATQAMGRPFTSPKSFTTNTVQKRVTGKVQAAYFTNWGIYGANFQPTDITPSDLTHIVYAFADVTPTTGSIFLTDSYADEQKHFPGDSWSEPGNNLYGCLKQLYLLKLAHRNLKVLLSVGGWTYSQDGHFSFVTSPSLRATFVSSAIQLIRDYGFDGIDIDFEYPSGTAQGQGFANLFTELRAALDTLAKTNGDTVPYQLTAAVSAGSANYASLVVPQMDSALTYWNLMAYDYAGSWLTWADNQANLYGGGRTNVSTDNAIKWYLSQGATVSKINMGIPLYGRAFDNTAGLGAPYNGVGPGTFEAGIYSYSVLPLTGAQVFENTTDVTSYSYNPTSQELVSYDTPNIATLKAKYVQEKGLAGSMFWDLSTDKTGSNSLVGTTAGVYGSLDQTLNHINYPNSKWDNIRSNMGQGTSSSTTSAPSSTPSSTSSTPSSTSTIPSSGACASVAAWSSAIAYNGGQTVTYNAHLWTAKWWTQADVPGGSAGVWTDSGPC